MRIGGLASGMDIDSLVSDLMRAERMPLDQLKQKKQIIEWQRDEYRAMNTLLLDFRNELTQMKLTTKYRVRSVTSSNEALVTATASSAASLNSFSISKVDRLAKAENWVTNNSIAASNRTIDATKSLASQKTDGNFATQWNWNEGAVGSQTLLGNGSKTGMKLNLAAGEAVKATAEFGKMSVKVNGVSYQVIDPASTDPLGEKQVKIADDGSLTFGANIATNASVKVNYITNKKVQTTTLKKDTTTWQLEKQNINNNTNFSLTINGAAVTVASDGTFSTGKVDFEKGTITFNNPLTADTSISVNYTQNYADFQIKTYTSTSGSSQIEEKFLVESSNSLNQVINTVNASKAGVSMFFDSATGKISMMRTETGDFYDDNTNGTYDPQNPTDLSVTRDYDVSITGNFARQALQLADANVTKTHGENASFVINGLQTTRSSNTFDINGVSITLKKEFVPADGPVSLLVKNDSDQIYENIKGFIDKYNELIGKINAKVSEEKYRSYKPLTDEQREQLSDKQQELWEEKAKSGLLRRDSMLTSALSSMRLDFYQPVTNSDTDPLLNQLSAIGITTTSNYLEGGKLEISESKLKEAINNNPDAIEALFRGGSDSTLDSEKGIMHRLYDTVNSVMDQLKEKAGNSFSTNSTFALGKSLLDIDNRIDRFEDRLIQIEDRYWRQFTAMEKAIQQSNQQSAFLMNQFSGGM
ncbi:flagellar filament capping protein FliD [Metabacillus halosaccharovorans]|uniref:flagellar filament capping protein FliD n=1 Tax=Metabacillus halosaccharovorans TaxID=930124 RepID=UPI002041A0A4|nr:flagellar filament capping protein FliD [Metabacillus halosaccharovorans]MCM3443060.1 flagellar filament capping protein FliD [Metabacillus halosaccharovorans]